MKKIKDRLLSMLIVVSLLLSGCSYFLYADEEDSVSGGDLIYDSVSGGYVNGRDLGNLDSHFVDSIQTQR